MRRAAVSYLSELLRSSRTWAASAITAQPPSLASAIVRLRYPARFSSLKPFQACSQPFQHQYQQLALFRTHVPHATPIPGKHADKAGKSWLLRGLGAAGKAMGLAMVAVPLTGVAALVVVGMEDADATELILSVPRSMRAVWWGVHAAYHYKSLAARHDDRVGEAYLRELALLHEEAAQSLLLMCQTNGGVYIKAGQLAVSLNAVPQEYRRTLEVLQDKVPPRPFDDINRALVHELGAPAEELFMQFDPVATAAASLAQVHKALMKDGSEVAVKVQYPGLDGAVMADVAGMVTLARVGAWLFPEVNLVWLFEELQRKLSQELDFRIEARNSGRLAECVAGRKGVAVPRVVPQLSGKKVLCMEWVDGCKVSDEQSLQQMGLSPRDVGLLLLEAFGEMIFVHGFVHGDPHPGNILVRPDWESQGWLSWLFLGRRPRPELVLLDHGLYIELPEDMRQQYCQMWCAFVLNDKETAVQAATALGGEKAGRILPEVLRPRNWKAVSREERRKFRQEYGINCFTDLGEILEQAPRPLLDTLRLTSVVRHIAAQLGVTTADRLRINATAAFHGMELRTVPATITLSSADQAAPQLAPAAGQHEERVLEAGKEHEPKRRKKGRKAAAEAAGQQAGSGKREQPPTGVEYYGVLQSRTKRWQLELRLLAMRGAFWLVSVMQTIMERVVPASCLLA